jgi:hypothetical protein
MSLSIVVDFGLIGGAYISGRIFRVELPLERIFQGLSDVRSFGRDDCDILRQGHRDVVGGIGCVRALGRPFVSKIFRLIFE